MAEGMFKSARFTKEECEFLDAACENLHVSFGDLIRIEIIKTKQAEPATAGPTTPGRTANQEDIQQIITGIQHLIAHGDRLLNGLNKILNCAWGAYSMINYIAKNILPDKEAHDKYRQSLEGRFQ